jgi:hypothetical protein
MFPFILEKSRKFIWFCKAIFFDRFLLTLDHRGLILFLPYLSRTPAPPSITEITRIIDLRQVRPVVDFRPVDIDKSIKLAGNPCKSIGFLFVFVG